MTNLLFLCTANSARSQMAEAFARQLAPADVTVASAGFAPAAAVHPLAVEVMREVGFDLSACRPKAFTDFSPQQLDVVVTLCENAARECALLLPGHPTQVDWELPDPAATGGDEAAMREAFRASRDEIRRQVETLFRRGYLKALAWANGKADLILNSLSEGIIAHDVNRIIVYFNRAAEAITGYARAEVIGRDCHDVFPGNFCGAKCSFCHGCPRFERTAYPLDITTKSGERRHVEMSVQAITGETGAMLGVLASFRDLTHEHDLSRRLGEIESFSGIIGRDAKMLAVFELIRNVADADVPILIQGASGTGKELVAAAIHNEGVRADKLFVPVNCGALPENLLESELFGHVRGAFTGAIRDKKGRFELADGGTIFLDEIGDISAAMQVKLLRVLQEGTFERVGDSTTIKVNVRLISATHRDLAAEIAAGRFREDLFYRLCVVPVQLPTLAERACDIPLLVEHFLKRFADESGREPLAVAPEALDAMMSYAWPGNIRELQNAIQFALVKCRGQLIELSHLPPPLLAPPSAELPRATSEQPAGHRREGVKFTREEVLGAMRRAGGNKAKAARLLGVNRATLYRYLDKFRIEGEF